MLQYVKPWISSHDIAKGERGALEIAKKLNDFDFGLVCLTSDNLHNDWILFESGALSKKLETSAVYTFLLDLKPSDVRPPLGQFQHTSSEKGDVLKLLQSINSKHESPLSDSVLASTFEKFWPDLEKAIASIPSASQILSELRPDRELLEEILAVVREGRAASVDGPSTMVKTKEGIINSFVQGYISGADANITLKRVQAVGTDLNVYLLHDGEDVHFTVSGNLKWNETKAVLIKELDSLLIPF